MTFAKYIEERLIENGIWPHDAPRIVQMVMDDKGNDVMKDRWNHDVSEYPSIMKNVLWITAKQIALKFIDENQPMAWYRSIFTEGYLPNALPIRTTTGEIQSTEAKAGG